ncbi:MAG: hypothetical protein K5770_12085 [Lachnospiraceae bacterium]|nr:hypothetical protein [Lachnospiraceae bacterium]
MAKEYDDWDDRVIKSRVKVPDVVYIKKPFFKDVWFWLTIFMTILLLALLIPLAVINRKLSREVREYKAQSGKVNSSVEASQTEEQAFGEITAGTEETDTDTANGGNQKLGGSSEPIEWNDEEVYSDNTWGAGIPWDYVTGVSGFFGKTEYEGSDGVSLVVAHVLKTDYESYVDILRNSGFTEDYQKLENGYTGYNPDGWQLAAGYNEDDYTMEIYIVNPENSDQGREQKRAEDMEQEIASFSEIQWPETEPFDTMPRPKSNTGLVLPDSFGYEVKIGNTSAVDFAEYAMMYNTDAYDDYQYYEALHEFSCKDSGGWDYIGKLDEEYNVMTITIRNW